MAITIVGAQVNSGTGTAVTWNVPAHQKGDWLLCTVMIDDPSGAVNTLTLDGTWLDQIKNAENDEAPMWRQWKIAEGSGTTASGTLNESDSWRAQCVVVRGGTRNQSGWTGDSDGAANNISNGSLDVINGDALIWLLMARIPSSMTVSVSSSPSATWTETHDSNASNLHSAAAYSMWTTTATPTVTATWSGTPNVMHTARFVFRANNQGTISGTAPGLTSSMSGTVEDSGVSGTLAGTAPGLTSSIAGEVEIPGTIAGTFPALAGSLTGDVDVPPSGTIDGTLPAMISAITTEVTITATLTGTAPSATMAALGEATVPATLAGTAPALTGTLAGDVGGVGATLAGTTPGLASSITAEVTIGAEISGTLPTGEMSITAVLSIGAGSRVYTVPAESRIVRVGVDASDVHLYRTLVVEAEDRTTTPQPLQDRTLFIESEDRTVYVQE